MIRVGVHCVKLGPHCAQRGTDQRPSTKTTLLDLKSHIVYLIFLPEWCDTCLAVLESGSNFRP